MSYDTYATNNYHWITNFVSCLPRHYKGETLPGVEVHTTKSAVIFKCLSVVYFVSQRLAKWFDLQYLDTQAEIFLKALRTQANSLPTLQNNEMQHTLYILFSCTLNHL